MPTAQSSPADDAPPRLPKVAPIGGHIRVAGGLHRTGLANAERVGAEAVQIFVANPRGWAQPSGDPAEDERFRVACAERGIPVFVHSPYLINLGSPTPATVERSTTSLRHSLARGAVVGAQGVVVHTGSAVAGGRRAEALQQVRKELLPLLDEAAARGWPPVLLEPTAGQGLSLCARMEDLADYLRALDEHPHVAVCLDTCHAFAAGHDLTEEGGVARVLDLLAEAAGSDRLRLIHANDSQDVVGSFHDRHESIGHGHIGLTPFAELLAHPLAAGVPVVVETPEKLADHRHQIAVLRALRDGVEPPTADGPSGAASAGTRR